MVTAMPVNTATTMFIAIATAVTTRITARSISMRRAPMNSRLHNLARICRVQRSNNWIATTTSIAAITTRGR